jgi:hypothetical protein
VRFKEGVTLTRLTLDDVGGGNWTSEHMRYGYLFDEYHYKSRLGMVPWVPPTGRCAVWPRLICGHGITGNLLEGLMTRFFGGYFFLGS